MRALLQRPLHNKVKARLPSFYGWRHRIPITAFNPVLKTDQANVAFCYFGQRLTAFPRQLCGDTPAFGDQPRQGAEPPAPSLPRKPGERVLSDPPPQTAGTAQHRPPKGCPALPPAHSQHRTSSQQVSPQSHRPGLLLASLQGHNRVGTAHGGGRESTAIFSGSPCACGINVISSGAAFLWVSPSGHSAALSVCLF